MLVLQLFKDEFITIGDNIKVYCTKAGKKDSVTLGIEAPRELTILRTGLAELELRANVDDSEAQEILVKLDEARKTRRIEREERKIRSEKRIEKLKSKYAAVKCGDNADS